MIANRILKIEESSTLAMAQKSRDLIKQGKKIINLSLGEPDFETPQFIKNAAKEAIELIKKYNAKPVGLLIGLDRQEKGSHELSAKAELKKEFDIEVFSIINLDDLISYLHDKDYQSQQKLMNEYRSKWGA